MGACNAEDERGDRGGEACDAKDDRLDEGDLGLRICRSALLTAFRPRGNMVFGQNLPEENCYED